jgi:hypothetical protein
LMSKWEQSLLFISMQTRLIQTLVYPLLTQYPDTCKQSRAIDTCPVWLCFSVLFNQTQGMGQEKSTPWQRNRPLAKNAVPATVIPRRDRAKGNREERGGHHAAIGTNLSVKHTEEIKVTQPPFKTHLC